MRSYASRITLKSWSARSWHPKKTSRSTYHQMSRKFWIFSRWQSRALKRSEPPSARDSLLTSCASTTNSSEWRWSGPTSNTEIFSSSFLSTRATSSSSWTSLKSLKTNDKKSNKVASLSSQTRRRTSIWHEWTGKKRTYSIWCTGLGKTILKWCNSDMSKESYPGLLIVSKRSQSRRCLSKRDKPCESFWMNKVRARRC